MWWKNKKKGSSKYFWIEEGVFIDCMIRLLQTNLNTTDNDIRLRYCQRLSFPKRYRTIQIEFPDGRVRRSREELDAIAIELLDKFCVSDAFEKACRLLYLFTEDSRNFASECEISYVLAESCGVTGAPGVIIYWSK